jgi:hypothetical protein
MQFGLSMPVGLMPDLAGKCKKQNVFSFFNFFAAFLQLGFWPGNSRNHRTKPKLADSEIFLREKPLIHENFFADVQPADVKKCIFIAAALIAFHDN